MSLHSGIAHLAAAPFYDSSLATVANLPSTHAAVNLALTDPDSSTVVPSQSPRFRGSFMLTAQGDQQAIFAAHLGGARQQLQVLNLSQSVDDTAFATSAHGALITTDSTAQSVVLITGALKPGTAFTSVTPGNANTPPSPGGPELPRPDRPADWSGERGLDVRPSVHHARPHLRAEYGLITSHATCASCNAKATVT